MSIWVKVNDFVYTAEKNGWKLTKVFDSGRWRYSAHRSNAPFDDEHIQGSEKKVLGIVNYVRQLKLDL